MSDRASAAIAPGWASGAPPASGGVDPAAVRALLARIGGRDGAPADVVTHETHISWVFVVGERAFKLKKPVVLPFLDYGTPARRRAMCEAEVKLGRRLAPRIYRGVRALVADGDRLRLAAADDPRARDYVVEMDAFAPEATLAVAIGAGAVAPGLADRLGARLASFHAGCPGGPVERGAARARDEITANLDELRALTAGACDPRIDRFRRFLEIRLVS